MPRSLLPLTKALAGKPLLAMLFTLACTVSASMSRAQEPDYLSFATDDEANSTEIFSKASPAVVFVTNTALRRSFFTLNIQEIPQGAGTGFVWDKSGLIVTNFHVIAGAHKVTVTLHDRSEHEAQVIGLAPEKDLAVLRIKDPPEQLFTLPLGDSSELAVGRKVLAIGNPFGLDTSLTTGIVSALGREIEAPDKRRIRGVIQTDAAINPGNSGGPLLNSLGQLIGVNTAIYSPSGASAGIGFAIPVNTVKEVVPQLISYGRVLRPMIGVELASDQWVHRYRIEGVPVVQVYPGLPAARAGITGAYRGARGEVVLGDIITAVGDTTVRNHSDYYDALEQYTPGDKVSITTRRGNETRTFQVDVIESQ